MKQKELSELLGVSTRTLSDWKKSTKRANLVKLLSALDYTSAKILLESNSDETYLRVLENENFFDNQIDFEKQLYPLMLGETKKWKRFALNKKLPSHIRQRSAYIYTLVTKRKLDVIPEVKDIPLFHKNPSLSGDGFVRLYGLKNGIDMGRFTQYKVKGTF